ncbi:hypothetical protein ACIA5A_05240 [Micromonospora sp. NPDC051300]|uniref:hypothetical protein n=1 Tax=Micromonospora sp. NPDC051300 TaxID=3364286 RepID=UPI0037A406C0
MNVRQVLVGVAAVFVVAVAISATRWYFSDDRSPESFGALLLVSVLPGVVGALLGLLVARWVTGSRRRGRGNP